MAVPVGVQVIAGRFREDICLAVAAVIERACLDLTPIDPRDRNQAQSSEHNGRTPRDECTDLADGLPSRPPRRSGTTKSTSEEVVRAHLDRTHAANPALNAVVVDLGASAMQAAKAADETLAASKRAGGEVGPLHGVPVTIKINIDVEGQANSNGVVAFKDNIAPGDSPVTAQSREGRCRHHRPDQHAANSRCAASPTTRCAA